MKSLTKIVLASTTSLGVVGGVVYYNNPQIFQNQNVETVTQTENPAPVTPEQPVQSSSRSFIPYGNLFLNAGSSEIARSIKEVFNYDVINPSSNDPVQQQDFERIKQFKHSGQITFVYRALVRNSLQYLRVHNPARNAQFVSAINSVTSAGYFRQDESSDIVFPIKSHYDLIVQYWDETTLDATLSEGVDKETLKNNDLESYLTNYKIIFDYIYDRILFNKTPINTNLKQFRNNWFGYFRLNLNQELKVPARDRPWKNIYPIADFTLADLQDSWEKANNDYYLKKQFKIKY